MTSRERVETALQHREPDRIPVDLWGSASRITNELYFKILDELGYPYDQTVIRPGKTAEYVDYRISDLVQSDFRHAVARKPANFTAVKDENGIIYDEWGIGYKLFGQYAQIAFHPLAEAESGDIDKYKGPFIPDEGRLKGVREEVKGWHEDTNYYITATAPCSGLALDYCFYLRGQEQFFVDMYTNAKFAHKLLDKVSDIIAELYAYYVEPIAEYVGWVEYESDYGIQTSPWFPPDIYREFIRGPNDKVFQAVKKVAPDSKVFLHSCGAVRDIIPEFIENGVDILNSLQPNAVGMDSFALKRDFGQEIIFHGGVSIQGALSGSPEEAEQEAKTRIEAFAPGGGYIFSSTNHFQPDTPVKNFFAVYEAAAKYGKYPISVA